MLRNRIYTTTNKTTGRKWDYVVKESWNHIYYSFNGPVLRFRRSKTEARRAAVDAGDFRYNDERIAA